MQDLWLKSAAVAGWLLGFSVTLALVFDDTRWLVLLGVGGFSIGATACVMTVCRNLARHTRRALYRTQQWEEPAAENVTRLYG